MTKLTTEQQTILSFHNYMNCDCQLTEDMFLVAWDEFTLHPLEKLSFEYIKQATDKLHNDMVNNSPIANYKLNPKYNADRKLLGLDPNELTGWKLFLSRIGIR